jgi:hypothetical protein
MGAALAGTVAANQPDNRTAQTLSRGAIMGALMIPVTVLAGARLSRRADAGIDTLVRTGAMEAAHAAELVAKRQATAWMPTKIVSVATLPIGLGVLVGRMNRSDAFHDGQVDIVTRINASAKRRSAK